MDVVHFVKVMEEMNISQIKIHPPNIYEGYRKMFNRYAVDGF